MARAHSRRHKSVTPAVIRKARGSTPGAAAKRAAIFRNGANQAVRLPQELRFPDDVKEVHIRRQADGLFISPVKPDWSSFFALQVDVPDDFLESRGDTPAQPREPL